jgi:hypothetical protein
MATEAVYVGWMSGTNGPVWLLALGAVACASAPPLSRVPPDPHRPPTAAACVEGAVVAYRRPLDEHTELDAVFTCLGEDIVVTTIAIPREADSENEEGGDDELPIAEVIGEVSVKRFEAMRRAITAHIEAGDCRPVDRRSVTTLAIGNAKWRIACEWDPQWNDVAVEEALEVAFDEIDPRRQPPTSEPDQLWPFDGDYWRDELGYYRRAVSITSATNARARRPSAPAPQRSAAAPRP